VTGWISLRLSGLRMLRIWQNRKKDFLGTPVQFAEE